MWRALAISIACTFCAFADPAAIDQAKALYQKTQYRPAIQLLESSPEKNAGAWALLGKSYYGNGDFKASFRALEKAVAAEPENGQYWNWLGRAYGRQAESGSFFSAYGLARKCRAAFEKAVDLAPRDLQSMTDMFSYYLEAPGVLGGGTDKARRIAERIAEIDAAEHQSVEAQIARKGEDWEAAEQHYRGAMELEPEDIGRMVDLAVFLAERGRIEESDKLFEQAAGRSPDDPLLLYERARAYLKANRERAETRRLLEQYLAADLTPDDPPRWEARRLLEEIGGE